MKPILKLTLLLALAYSAQAQFGGGGIPTTTVNPNGTSCTANQLIIYVSGTTGLLYSCVSGLYASVAGSGAFVQLSGDAISGASGGATTVKGSNSVLFSSLATGLLKNTTGTGTPSIGVAGVDFIASADVTLAGAVTKLNGVLLSGLSPTGILKITTGTGAPSIATYTDFPITDTLAAGLPVPILDSGSSSDASTAFNDAGTAGLRIRLKDGATYFGINLSFQNNTTYVCNNCVIKCIAADLTHQCINTGATNVAFEGVTFEGNGKNIGAYTGANIASTMTTIATAGSGFQPNQSIGVSFTGGGCTLNPSGYMTVNGSGNATSVVLTQTGTRCTSTSTINTNFTTYPACPKGGSCVAPTFNYVISPNNTAGPTNLALWFVGGATNFRCTDCTFQSTGSVTTDASKYMSGLLIFNSSATLIRPKFLNTVAGTQIKIDTNNNATKPVRIESPNLDGSGFVALQVTSGGADSQGNVEISGGSCTNVTDVSFGTGQNGNCFSLFRTSHTRIHDTESINPYFSGIRVTGGSTNTVYNSITNNKINGCGEVGMWAELGAELNTFVGNSVYNCQIGISATNLAQRPYGAQNVIVGNVFRQMSSRCASVDSDVFVGNECVDMPLGLIIGNGGTGTGINPSGNVFHTSGVVGAVRMDTAISVSKGLTSTSTNTGVNLGQNTVDNAVTPFFSAENGFPLFAVTTIPVITAMTNANPPVFTAQTMTGGAMNNSEVWILSNIPGATLSDGTTPVSGQSCTLASVSTTSFTCSNLNTLAGGAFTLPAYGTGSATAIKKYSSGTTPAWTWPAMVTADILANGNPTLTAGGCTAALSAGSTSRAGSITTATGTCTAAALTPGYTAPHGWACNARDRTTPANQITFTPTSTTVASFSGTSSANDVIDYTCLPW